MLASALLGMNKLEGAAIQEELASAPIDQWTLDEQPRTNRAERVRARGSYPRQAITRSGFQTRIAPMRAHLPSLHVPRTQPLERSTTTTWIITSTHLTTMSAPH